MMRNFTNTRILNRFLTTTRSCIAGPIEKKIHNKLDSIFSDASFKEVVNTSWKHRRGNETHFEVILVSDKFENKSILERNKMLNEILVEEIRQIHSISFKLLPLSKWELNNREKIKIKNPPCVNRKINQ